MIIHILMKKVPKTANVPFLKNDDAAELLAVDVRTVKRWMQRPDIRSTLGAARHGKQWRIPRSDNLDYWRIDTRRRLKALGIGLTPEWKSDLRKIAKTNARYIIESYRLWLAAYLKVLLRGNISPEDRQGILLLWQTACRCLGEQPRGTRVDTLKSRFPEKLRGRNFSDQRIAVIMQYWPDESHFNMVRGAHTLEALEAIRRGLDTLEATRALEQNGQKPTAQNLRPLFHRNIMEHINDTREKLTGIVVRPRTPKELRHVEQVSIYLTNEQRAGMVIDLRKPQDGLPLRTFRNRHPLRKSPQRGIIAEVYGVRENIPGPVETPNAGKTPIRKPRL